MTLFDVVAVVLVVVLSIVSNIFVADALMKIFSLLRVQRMLPSGCGHHLPAAVADSVYPLLISLIYLAMRMPEYRKNLNPR